MRTARYPAAVASDAGGLLGTTSAGAPIAYYCSAHGYGHGVRSCDIIRALAGPDVPVVVVSDLPETFFRNRLDWGHVSHRGGAFDVGMVQLDSIRVDVPATLEKVAALYARAGDLVAREVEFLRAQGIAAVVADVPALPLEAAARAGIPGIAVGNFGWDWIYAEFAERDPRWRGLIDRIARGYAAADLLIRLPFAAPMPAFRRVREVPLLSAPGRNRRAELAAYAECAVEGAWALLSFTTLDWDDAALDRVERIEGWEFFTVEPLGWRRRNIHPVDRTVIPFADVMASVDAVVSKPGFGVVSECIVNRKPLAYVDRSDFREYAILVAAIETYLKAVHLPSDRLYAGDLLGTLEALRRRPEPEHTLPGGGAAVAAREIAALVSTRSRG